MKDILIEGHRLLTTDEIADAVIDYARVLHLSQHADVVEFPTLLDGEISHCSLLLTPVTSVAVVDADVLPPTLPGAGDAHAEIQRRADALR
jgi:anaerobic glycerol-3-phosphate dehydrogenase